MSVPARTLPDPAPSRPTRTVPAPKKPGPKKPAPKKPAPATTRTAPSVRTTPARPRPVSPPQPRARARRGFHLAYWIFAASVVSLIVVGIVALNAMVVNTTYRMESAQQELDDLSSQQKSLSTEVARLSSPSRIADWAATQKMVMPDDVVILRVAGVGAGA